MSKRIGLKCMGVFVMVLLSALLLVGCFEKEKIENEENKDVVEKPNIEENQENNQTVKEEKTGVFIGDKAYDFTLLDREGNEIKLSDLKGKVVFINFFTTWNGACVQQMPHIQQIYDTYKDQDVVILAVNVLAAEKKPDMETVNKFLDEHEYSFPVLYDVDGEVYVKYKVRSFPSTYIIDKDGHVADFVSEAMDKDKMIEKIEAVLNK